MSYVSICFDCPRRKAGCAVGCAAFLAERAERRKELEDLMRQKELAQQCTGILVKGHSRRKKRYGK